MRRDGAQQAWAWLLGRAALAVLAYHAGILLALLYGLVSRSAAVQLPLHFAFLLAPLEVVFRKRGAADFLKASVLALAILAALRLALAASALHELSAAGPRSDLERVVLAPLPKVVLPLVAVELATATALAVGLAWVEVFSAAFVRWRVVYRLLAACAAGSLGGLAMIALLARNHGFVEGMSQLFANVTEMFRRAMIEADSPTTRLPEPQVIMQAFWDYVFGSMSFGYFLNLAGAWYVGRRVADRSMGRLHTLRLRGFALPDVLVWPLIASWAVVLAGRFAPLGYLRALALNAGLVMLALFGIQGLAIIDALLARSRWAGETRRVLILAVLVALLVPAIAVIAMVLVPLVGVSEIWVRYRYDGKGQSDEGEGDT